MIQVLVTVLAWCALGASGLCPNRGRIVEEAPGRDPHQVAKNRAERVRNKACIHAYSRHMLLPSWSGVSVAAWLRVRLRRDGRHAAPCSSHWRA